MDIWLLTKGLFFIGGVVWCKEVHERFGADWEYVRSEDGDPMRKWVLIGVWGITVLIFLGMLYCIMPCLIGLFIVLALLIAGLFA